MLIDDDRITNIVNERLIKKADCTESISIFTSAEEALKYLKNDTDENYVKPQLIFLDINMPVMNGWQFLDEYKLLKASQKADAILMMLTSSLNIEDEKRAHNHEVELSFKRKPLTSKMLQEILESYFNFSF